MNFEQYLRLSAKQINKELNAVFKDFLESTKKTNCKLAPFARKFIEANMGGKRIRGVLCKLGYELASVKRKVQSVKFKTKEIIKIASALEILHTALLIHDDIMDKSLIRRNKHSLYKTLGGGHQAISQAISIGDIGFYLPVKLITDTSFADKLKLKVLSFLSEVIINTGWGQILDVEGDKEDLEFIRIYKTAKYTIAGPMQIGAMLAGASDKLINDLGELGENLGIAFQIQDDILDGEAAKLDLQHSLALKYVSGAKKIIPIITSDSKMRKLLEEMGNYLVERNK